MKGPEVHAVIDFHDTYNLYLDKFCCRMWNNMATGEDLFLTFDLLAITADWNIECEIQHSTTGTSQLYLEIWYENFYAYCNICNHCKKQKFEAMYTLTHSRSWALLEKARIVELLKNFPVF
jgi:hypothetical protein